MRGITTDVLVDVLVIGAGPAGAVAALNLAPSRQVIMVERQADAAPRIGESLPPAARRLLSDMGLLEAFLQDGHAPCHGNRAVWGTQQAFDTDWLRDPDGHGWHLDRTRFDAWLRMVALERGAALLAPARVTAADRHDARWQVQLDTEDGPLTISAAVVIDAGGRAAPLARRIGAQRQHADKLVCGWLHGTDAASSRNAGLTYVEACADGWWYTAPLPNGRRVLAFHTDADLPAAGLARDRAALLQQAAGLPELSALLAESGFTPDEHSGFTAAHSAVLEPCAGPGWLAAGDAALSFDPLSSQGLLNALFTGLAAAEAADRLIDGADDAVHGYRHTIASIHRAYRQHLHTWYGAEQRWPAAPFWQRRHALQA